MILCLRVVPGLSYALAAARRPELHARPAVVGSLPSGRGAIREINALAAGFGIHPGMTPAQARQHCPDVVVLLPDPAREAAVGEEMGEIVRTYTPQVQPLESGLL